MGGYHQSKDEAIRAARLKSKEARTLAYVITKPGYNLWGVIPEWERHMGWYDDWKIVATCGGGELLLC